MYPMLKSTGGGSFCDQSVICSWQPHQTRHVFTVWNVANVWVNSIKLVTFSRLFKYPAILSEHNE